jgi:hypothetical protein
MTQAVLERAFPQLVVTDALNYTMALHRYRSLNCSAEVPHPQGQSTYINDNTAKQPRPQFTTAPHTTLATLELEFMMGSDIAHDAIVTLTKDFALREFLWPFEVSFCRDRSFECRHRLEFDPAPSPPPPMLEWSIPPSPPVFAFEIGVMTFGVAGSGIYILFTCICCMICLGNRVAGRQLPRWYTHGKDSVNTIKNELELLTEGTPQELTFTLR